VVDRRIEQSTSIVEMRMHKWMRGVTRKDRIRNGYVRGSYGVALTIWERMTEMVSAYATRRVETEAVRAIMQIDVEEQKDVQKKLGEYD